MEKVRNVIAYKNYFLDFYKLQSAIVKKKIEWTLRIMEYFKVIPKKYFTHIEGTNGLYEIRIEFEGNIFRIFAFFDKGNIIVLGNGFQKKTQKTPEKEIKKALKIKKEYERDYNTR
jgi:phage-related protein